MNAKTEAQNVRKPTVANKSEVTQSCPALHHLMDCSPPGFSIHGIFQVRVLEWGAIAFSRYAGDTTRMAESEELKSPLMKLKEGSGKVGLKLNIQKRSWHHFMANRWGNSGHSKRLYYSGLQNHCRW